MVVLVGGAWADGVPMAGAPPAATALRKKVEAHTCLNGPGVLTGERPAGVGDGPVTAACGKNASARSFHVIAATTPSTRGSAPASISARAPP